MTVKDLLIVTHYYQDFQLKICEYGTCKKLFEDFIYNDSDLNKFKNLNKYLDKKIAEILFGTNWINIILEMEA